MRRSALSCSFMSGSPMSGSPMSSDVRVLRNAYRVLGLPGEAGWAAIRAAAAEEARETGWDLPWLGPLPRPAAERGLALNRLLGPHQRLRERLFWFHDGSAEDAVRGLEPDLLSSALEGWAEASSVTGRHDAALVALLAAMTLDPEVEDAALWQTALERWQAVLTAEEYWLAVIRVEAEGGFEIPAPFAEIYECRENALGLVAGIPAAIARAAMLEEDHAAARRAIDVLRAALPEEVHAPLIGDLASHLDRGGAGAAVPVEPVVPAAPESPPAEAVRDERAVPAVVPDERGAAGPDTPPDARRPRRRRALPVAISLALLAAAALALLPLRHRFPGGESTGPRGGSPEIRAIEQRLDENDGRLAEALVERRAAEADVVQTRGAVADYQRLIDDYRQRAEYRLNIDRAAYDRVVLLHDRAVQQHTAAVARRDSLVRRVEQLRLEDARLVSEHNAQI